jgi:hypothetical protein
MRGIAGMSVVGASEKLDGASPIRIAIECSNCARLTPTSRSCACAPFSCCSACTKSTRAATPAL